MLNRAFFAGVLFFCFSQLICLNISNISKTRHKQVIEHKRQAVKSIDFSKDKGLRESVFFFGSSKILAAIIPKFFDECNEDGTYSYNFAIPGLPLASQYFIFKEYLEKTEVPDYAIIKLNNGIFPLWLFPSFSIQGASLSEVLQYAFLTKDVSMLFNYFIPSRVYWSGISRFIAGRALSLVPDSVRALHKSRYLNFFSSKNMYYYN